MLSGFLALLFPPKCVLCKTLLTQDETDYCNHCRKNTPEFKKSHTRLSFLAGWTSVWYYKDNVRAGILRFKFYGRRSYAPAFGRTLAMKLRKEGLDTLDVLTFVPIAPLRRFFRGYDQVELLADAAGKELGVPYVQTLVKIRNTPPQSGIKDVFRRRANVLGAYRAVDPETLRGKRIVLLDDVITTGATASECARVLLTAGAKEVYCVTLAAANPNK